MSDYTRLTVQGTLNRADLVLPSDEPLAGLLPEMLTLLHEPAEQARPLSLVTVKSVSNGHGYSVTATVRDRGVERLVGDHAPNVAVSSTKSMTGHLLGAAGAIESIFSVLAIRDQVAPPTINLNDPEMETPIDLVPNKAKPMKIDVAMSNSFGFGGTNASVIFKKVD